MHSGCLPAVALGVTLVFLPAVTHAEVKRIEITSRTDVQNGAAFGNTGAYEKLVGKVYFAADPGNPRNKVIVNVDKAPRNARGEVEFSADLSIYTPKDPSRGNGVLLFDIVNRGGSVALGDLNRADSDGDIGDGFVMREGYTLVAVGWQFDVADDEIGLDAPIATDNGKAMLGRISTWFIPNQPTSTMNFGGTVYRPVDPTSAAHQLTEREGYFGAAAVVPRANWGFNDGRSVFLKTGFLPGRTYELTYQTQNPPVAGLGFAAVRDLASALKHNPDAIVRGRYAYAFGRSQTGRFLRAFLYEGFNTDERERQTFDALFIHVAGGAFGSFNEHFAQPNDSSFFTTAFPYRYRMERDPATGKMDGLGARVPKGADPKIFVSNSSAEYWGASRVAALTHVSLDGRQDVQDADNVRNYMLAGTQHGAGRLPPAQTNGQLRGNTNDYRFAQRALLVALDNWVRKGMAPPPSRHPKLSDRTLVAHRDIKFPEIAAVQWPYKVPGGFRSDLGGSPASHPVPFLVPQVDGDGNETGGIRLPEVAVPLAATTGWAFRSERTGAPTQLMTNTGSYLPFAATRADRERIRDPRPSIAERYPSRADYLQRIDAAARRLADERFVLTSDIPAIVERAGRHWDLLVTKGSATTTAQ
jgi:Alpha/beta hydrolase domain